MASNNYLNFTDLDMTKLQWKPGKPQPGKGTTVFVNGPDGAIFVRLGTFDYQGLVSPIPAVRAEAESHLAHITTPFHYKDMKMDNGVEKRADDSLLLVKVDDATLAAAEAYVEAARVYAFNNQALLWPKKAPSTSREIINERIPSLVNVDEHGNRTLRVKAFFTHAPRHTEYYMLTADGQLAGPAGIMLQHFKVNHAVTIGVRLGGLSVVNEKAYLTLPAEMMGGIYFDGGAFAKNPESLFGAGCRRAPQVDAATAAALASAASDAAAEMPGLPEQGDFEYGSHF